MASPISPMEAIDIIERAIELYKKVKDMPEQIKKIGRRMERLDGYLHELQDLLDTKKNPGGIASLRPVNTAQLEAIMKDIKKDGQKVYELLRKWEKNIGPGGVVLRFDWFAHLVFAMGSSPDKLDELADDIDKHLVDINHFIVILLGFAQNKQLVQRAPPPPSPKLAPVTPSPQGFNVLFVDGFNVGRSRIAEAYCLLLGRSTIAIQGTSSWKVNKIYSAGILPTQKTSCAQELVDLGEKLVPGGAVPNSVAVESLFDNKSFDFPFKQRIREELEKSKSKGLPAQLFAEFDFVVVFTKGHELKMIKLRDMLIEKHGSSARPRGKGKIVLLGDYLTGKPGSEIFEPQSTRDEWNKTTAIIKASLKSFLKQDIGWKQDTSGKKP
jgi:protein-tyrosine-phosphatase